MTDNLTHIPADIQALADQAGVTPEVTVTTITTRDRSPANAEKVAILADLLSVVDEEEVDKYFLGMLGIARDTGLNLKGSPVEMLQSIERKHQSKPEAVKPYYSLDAAQAHMAGRPAVDMSDAQTGRHTCPDNSDPCPGCGCYDG